MENVSIVISCYISDWLGICSDMMFVNEILFVNSDNVDKEFLVIKKGGDFFLVYVGFSDGFIVYGDKIEDWLIDYDLRICFWYKDVMF